MHLHVRTSIIKKDGSAMAHRSYVFNAISYPVKRPECAIDHAVNNLKHCAHTDVSYILTVLYNDSLTVWVCRVCVCCSNKGGLVGVREGICMWCTGDKFSGPVAIWQARSDWLRLCQQAISWRSVSSGADDTAKLVIHCHQLFQLCYE